MTEPTFINSTVNGLLERESTFDLGLLDVPLLMRRQHRFSYLHLPTEACNSTLRGNHVLGLPALNVEEAYAFDMIPVSVSMEGSGWLMFTELPHPYHCLRYHLTSPSSSSLS